MFKKNLNTKWFSTLNLLIIISINLCFLLLLLLDLYKEWPKEWDSLSFFGALIGSVAGLSGVYWTLRRQKEERFVEIYPKKIINLDSIIQELSLIRDIHLMHLTGLSESQFQASLSSVTKKIDNLVSLSTEVDGITYTLTKEVKKVINKAISDLRSTDYRTFNNEGDDGYSFLSRELRKNYSFPLRNNINKYYEKLDEHRTKIQDMFSKYID